MRKVTYGGACSLDLYLASTDGGVDWIRWSDEVQAIMAEYWATVDTVLVGRKTYEVAARSGGGGSFPGVKGYVASRTLQPNPGDGVEIVRDAVEFLRMVKGQEGKDICVMGGGDLARSLLEAGLIDEVGVSIHPLLLGSGVPVFHPLTRRVELELTESRTLKNGCVVVTYRVLK
jgi:dihydrofolate reductase